MSDVQLKAEAAARALFELEEAPCSCDDESNPNIDLRRRVYRARIEVNESAWAAKRREELRASQTCLVCRGAKEAYGKCPACG